MKTSCSLISPVSRLMKRISTNRGAWYETSFSLHSSTVYLGSPNSCLPNSTHMSLVEFSMGLMSLNA